MRCLIILLAILCLASSSRGALVSIVLQDGVNGYVGTTDVSVSADSRLAGRNFGAMDSIDIWQDRGVAFLRFELSTLPKHAVIKSARLELYAVSAGFSDEEISRPWLVEVFESTLLWREGTGDREANKSNGATSASYDGSNAWPSDNVASHVGLAIGSANLRGPFPGWFRWTLDAKLAQRWQSDPTKNRGIMLLGHPMGKAISFASRECRDSAYRPRVRLLVELPDGADLALRRKMAAERRLRLAKDKETTKSNDSPAHRLASLQAGNRVAPDDPKVETFLRAMAETKRRFPRESESEIADVTIATWRLLSDKGVDIKLDELLFGLALTVDTDAIGHFRYSDIAACYVLIATTPVTE